MAGRISQSRMCLSRIQSVFVMHEGGRSNRYISFVCQCSASTVSNILTKYRPRTAGEWSAMNTYEKARYVYERQRSNVRGRRRFRGCIADVEVRDYVCRKLVDEQWSPEIISNRIQGEIGKSVSAKTIYRFVKKDRRDLKKYLYEKGKARRSRVGHRRGRFKQSASPEKKYITVRPDEINTREEFGHWEGDLVVGPKRGSKFVTLTLVERKSRLRMFFRLPNREADTVLGCMRAFLLQLPAPARRSVTLDNGPEFAPSRMHQLQWCFSGFKVYYTEPYSPEQKGSNEHANGRLRKKFPKRTDFAFVSKEELAAEAHRQNTRPMKLHRYKTPLECYQEEIGQGQCLLAA